MTQDIIIENLNDVPLDRKIVIQGAREHNLKNVDLEIPRNNPVKTTILLREIGRASCRERV